MIFTTGVIMMMLGFAIGHLFGEDNVRKWNVYDYVGSSMFILGVIGVFCSIFTITWKYMP